MGGNSSETGRTIMYMWDLGERIKKLRISKGYTQQQLAERMNVTKSLISAYETGLKAPSYSNLISIANIFKVSTDYLLGVKQGDGLDLSGLSDEQKLIITQLVQSIQKT